MYLPEWEAFRAIRTVRRGGGGLGVSDLSGSSFVRIPVCLCVSHVEKGDVADNLCLEARTGLPFRPLRLACA